VKKWISIALFLALGVTAVVWFLNNKPVTAAPQPRTQAVDRGDLVERISVTGRTVPRYIYPVGTDLLPAGKVVWVNSKAELGDVVKEGDELARLDDEYAKAQLEQAKAKKDAAESNVKKAEAGKLRAEAAKERAENSRKAAQKAVDTLEDTIKKVGDGELRAKYQKELDLAKDSLAAYDAGLKEADAAIREAEAAKQAADGLVKEAEQGITVAQKALKPLSIKAPASGTIIKKEINLGQIVSPQATPTLFVIADLGRMQVVAQVGESDIARVKKGMIVRFKIDAYLEEVSEFQGTVRWISEVPLTTPLGTGGQKVDPAAVLTAPVLYPVVVDVLPVKDKPNFKLLAGLTANVDFVLKEVSGALRVPSDALGYKPDDRTAEEEKLLTERSQGLWKPLWVQQNGSHRQLIFVQTGISSDGKTQITEVDGKLEPGMQVIVEGPPAAANGGMKLPFKL
jgi:HlyD family secretion protein